MQVKSSASAMLILECAARLEARGYDLSLIACHSPHGNVSALPPGVRLLDRAAPARLACEAGLTDWVIAKTRAPVR